MKVEDIKVKYNYWLGRYSKAEEFFKTNTNEECEKHLELLYEIVRELSKLMQEYRRVAGKEMTEYENKYGFEGV